MKIKRFTQWWYLSVEAYCLTLIGLPNICVEATEIAGCPVKGVGVVNALVWTDCTVTDVVESSLISAKPSVPSLQSSPGKDIG